MPLPILFPALVAAPGAPMAQTPPDAAAAPQEPDGARTLGVRPPFRGTPEPPAWLRLHSHAHAQPSTRHYVYEAYAGEEGWLVRYQMLPEEGEHPQALETVLLYPKDGPGKNGPKTLQGVAFSGRQATVDGKTFALVDHRDLLKP